VLKYKRIKVSNKGEIMKKNKVKTIALIAHDNKKAAIVNWALKNKATLEKYNLCGTGTTAKLIAEATDLPVKRYLSGPLGGDQQIGAKVAEGKIDIVIFFWDPLESQPHDPDVKALLRIAVVYDIPIATNRATADFVIHSAFLQ
jgi:methylglyoxal synthase